MCPQILYVEHFLRHAFFPATLTGSTGEMLAMLIAVVPIEVVDSILQHLKLADIRRLRLTCRTMEERVGRTQRFQEHCDQKAVDLQSQSLSSLSSAVVNMRPARFLEHLTLNGIVWITEGLERTLRDGTMPADSANPCGLARDPVGNCYPRRRRPASSREVEAAAEQLVLYRQRIQESEDEEYSERLLASLVHLLRMIRVIRPSEGLRSIKIGMNVLRGQGPALPPHLGTAGRRARAVARRTAIICLKACHRSGIELRHLDVFTDTESCGAQPDIFEDIMSELHIAMRKSLTKVSLSLTGKSLHIADLSDASAAIDPDDEYLLAWRQRPSRESRRRLFRHAWAKSTADETTPASTLPENSGLAMWLNQISRLDDLHLQFYSSPCSLSSETSIRVQCCSIVHHITERSALTKLRRITLCGWRLETLSMMAILSHSPALQTVCLRDITLTKSGQTAWREIFTYLTSPGANIAQIELSNLFECGDESTGYVVCSRRGRERNSTSPKVGERCGVEARITDDWDAHRPSTRDFDAFILSGRGAVRGGIDYWVNARYIVGSVQNSLWREFRRRQYGAC